MALIIFFLMIASLIGLLIYLRIKNSKVQQTQPKFQELPISLRKGLLYWFLGALGIIFFIIYSAIKNRLGTGIIIDIIFYGICLWLLSFAWNIHIKIRRTDRGVRLVAFKKSTKPSP